MARPGERMPNYELLAQHLKALIEAGQERRARFLWNWRLYFQEIEDPDADAELQLEAEQIRDEPLKTDVKGSITDLIHHAPSVDAIIELGERMKEMADQYFGKGSKAALDLDETLQWAPRGLQELVIGIIREYDGPSLSKRSPHDRWEYVQTKLKEFYGQNLS